MRPRHPREWSDRTLRRVAWLLWWVQAAILTVTVWHDLTSEPYDSSWGGTGGLVLAVQDLFPAVFALVGLLILVRHPRTTIGWVLQAVGLSWVLPLALAIYAAVGLVERPGSLPGAAAAAALGEGAWVPFIMSMGTFLILLFPDGRLPTRAWRPVAWVAAVTTVVLPVLLAFSPGPLTEGPVPGMVNPLGLESLRVPLSVAVGLFLALVPFSILASAASLAVRFRRSTGVVRQQLKWLTFAGVVVAVLYVVTMAISLLGSPASSGAPGWLQPLQSLSLLSFTLLPIGIGIAVQRYRLFDIDVVINRTLVYTSLSGILALAYLAAVLLLQLVVSPLTSSSELAVAGSTLAVAALFRPARSAIQHAVDKRFYRSRYDAQRTVEAFAGRLRSQLDLEAVGEDLRGVVADTVAPVRVSVWLRGAR